eukprot:4409694-Amphidinium_carterae.1
MLLRVGPVPGHPRRRSHPIRLGSAGRCLLLNKESRIRPSSLVWSVFSTQHDILAHAYQADKTLTNINCATLEAHGDCVLELLQMVGSCD